MFSYFEFFFVWWGISPTFINFSKLRSFLSEPSRTSHPTPARPVTLQKSPHFTSPSPSPLVFLIKLRKRVFNSIPSEDNKNPKMLHYSLPKSPRARPSSDWPVGMAWPALTGEFTRAKGLVITDGMRVASSPKPSHVSKCENTQTGAPMRRRRGDTTMSSVGLGQNSSQLANTMTS